MDLIGQARRFTTEEFLSIGGDDRLTLDSKSKLNKYLSSTYPQVGLDVIRRGFQSK